LLKGPEAPGHLSQHHADDQQGQFQPERTGVNALVKAFNDFQTTASSLGSYDATTKKAGALNGDSTLRAAQNNIRSVLGNIPTELSGAALQHLTDIGVTLQKDGKLSCRLDRK
jgi:flagellar hook-associated protein 2